MEVFFPTFVVVFLFDKNQSTSPFYLFLPLNHFFLAPTTYETIRQIKICPKTYSDQFLQLLSRTVVFDSLCHTHPEHH